MAQYDEVKKGGGFFFSGDRIKLYFFDSKGFGLKVLDEGQATDKRTYGSPEKAFSSAGCVAGVNGSFFTRENNPLGLVVANSKQLHVLETGSFTVAGVVYDTGKGIFIERSRVFANSKKRSLVKEAIQGGPFLVEGGNKVKGLDKEKEATRTFIATDGKGKWCLGVTSSLSLDKAAEWLAKSKALGEFKVKTALNLDGGSSSLFWTKKEGSKVTPLKPVRNYLGIVPR